MESVSSTRNGGEKSNLGCPNQNHQCVRYYRTSHYKMNYMETSTGLKMVLNTDPGALGIPELLRTMYQDI
uniref:Ovule protein n=1 Tax=Heterorhabditis bacteriophora TaxID=37862 RepID=A0A1I7W6Z7_HETBA